VSAGRTSLISLPALALLFAALGGCKGPNCQDACLKLYGESECNIQRVGDESRDERISDCLTECEAALLKPGEIREEFNPEEYTPSDEPVEITNDQEAALWMECVEKTACELIDNGYCAPLL
jgi:hypothetical protein